MKALLLLGLGAPATVRRRLQRLVDMGVIHKNRVRHDARICQLEVDVAARAACRKYLKMLARL